MFSSKVGQLSANHFLTIVKGVEQLPEMGRRVLWEGAQDIVFDRESPATDYGVSVAS
jgi:hypothetical protein